MQQIFTAPDAWLNGFYTLAMEYEIFSLQTDEAVSRLWQHPALDGCYLDRDMEPADQPRVPAEFVEPRAHLYGVATLPGGRKVPCGCLLWLFGDHPDWIEFYVPMASLDRVYPTEAFPYDGKSGQPWQRELDDWFAAIARFVYRHVPFEMAAIGFEVSTPDLSASKVRSEGMSAFGVSSYLLPTNKGLQWHPVGRKPTIEIV